MEPQSLLVGLVSGAISVAVLLYSGWLLRDRAATEREALLGHERDALVEQLTEALEQGESGREAASIILASQARRMDALRAPGGRPRRRLLLGAGEEDPAYSTAREAAGPEEPPAGA